MSTLYFDLKNGISGDMAVAALLGLGAAQGAGIDELRTRLEALGLDGYRIESAQERRSGILGNSFSVIPTGDTRKRRDYREIRALIEGSGLDNGEKELALSIFEHIAHAEARVHGVPVGDVHFHEIGAVDSIVDIVSFAILYRKHGFSSSVASPIPLGSGEAESMHGTIPVPAPATLEIVRGLPVMGTDARHELTTPTGAAIVKAVVKRFGPLPVCVIRNVSMGFGKRRSHGINALRLLVIDEIADLGEHGSLKPSAGGRKAADQTVTVIEVTIDDSTPEELGYLSEELFSRGALDVYVSPIFMKKNRPAFNVTVICSPELFEPCSRAVLEHSSSFGLRYQYYNRRVLDRSVVKVETRFGPISVKVGSLGGRVVKASPEYEECRAAARAFDVPLREVFREAECAYRILESHACGTRKKTEQNRPPTQ